jgi:hypothetical protein
MPQKYNAESMVVLPGQPGENIDQLLQNMGDGAEFACALGMASPGGTFVSGFEGGLELALRNPDAALAVLRHIDARKAEADTRESVLANAAARSLVIAELEKAALGLPSGLGFQPPEISSVN